MKEKALRKEAVRRRLAGESAEDIAADLGRTARWVRKWVARHDEDGHHDVWAHGRSRAPHHSPNRIDNDLREAIIAARQRLVANARAQYGALAVQWELRRLGIDPIPPTRTVERVIARAGLSNPRRRQPGYVSKGVPYPAPRGADQPGGVHQIDLVGPRHLHGGIAFHAVNGIDMGSHEAANGLVATPRPTAVAQAVVGMWARTGTPAIAQFDNHSILRGGIPPAAAHFGPVVATCLQLGVVPRFIPLREPWRNGVVEHFNDVWDKSFFRTETFTSRTHLATENDAFIAFHNAHHRYSAHNGQTPDEIWRDRLRHGLPDAFAPPDRLPAKGKIEVVRYIRSDRRLDLFGHRVTLSEAHTYQYVTAVIGVRAKTVRVVTIDGETIHTGPFPISRVLR
ncbi:MAG TPA: helix-turn-helix domain-containing protein [Euzebya sp.]|nr:helix-turn-helix domain-containing protein [Euzebya sp.]